MILNPEQKTEASNGGGRNPNRLYFGNLSFDKGKQDVETIFQDCGQITDIHIIRDRFTQRSQGYGFVTFATNEGKDKALLKNGQNFFGRPLKVNLEAKSKPDGGRVKTRQRLYVKNIPKETSEEAVKEVFAQFGTVENFFFIKDHQTNVSRGFGFIDFSNAEEAQAALSMNGQVAFGQTLIVKIAEEKNSARGGGRGRGGGFGRGRGGYNPYGAQGGYGGYNPYAQQQYGGYGSGGWNQQANSWQGYGRGGYGAVQPWQAQGGGYNPAATNYSSGGYAPQGYGAAAAH